MNEIDQMLSFDPLAAAEGLTGKSYKDDRDTLALGMLMLTEHAAEEREELALRDDTFYGSAYADTLRIFAELGFKVVHNHTFSGSSGGDEDFTILWRAGVLAVAESYRGVSTNNAKIYYNWKFADISQSYSIQFSGHVNDGVVVGDVDVRVAARHILAKLEAGGEVLSTWIERPFLWLLDYSQGPDDYDAINEQVIATFPEEVIKSIGPK